LRFPGTRNIAPNLFIGSEEEGLLQLQRSNDIVRSTPIRGRDYFRIAKSASILLEKKFQLNIFVDKIVESIDGQAFSSTPFGALQRARHRNHADGSAMRILRIFQGRESRCVSNAGVQVRHRQGGR
jgi:hypothetical protein